MTTILALTALLAAPLGEETGFWLGAAAVGDFGGPGHTYFYENGEGTDSLIILLGDGYWGVAALAGYTPTAWARFGLTLLELQAHWLGGVSAAFSPALGIYAQLEPPVAWRVRPYVWAGGTWTARLFAAMPPNTRVVEPMTTLRAGPGVTVRITPRLSAFWESDFLSVIRETEVDTRSGTVTDWEFSVIGIGRLQAGVRCYSP